MLKNWKSKKQLHRYCIVNTLTAANKLCPHWIIQSFAKFSDLRGRGPIFIDVPRNESGTAWQKVRYGHTFGCPTFRCPPQKKNVLFTRYPSKKPRTLAMHTDAQLSSNLFWIYSHFCGCSATMFSLAELNRGCVIFRDSESVMAPSVKRARSLEEGKKWSHLHDPKRRTFYVCFPTFTTQHKVGLK